MLRQLVFSWGTILFAIYLLPTKAAGQSDVETIADTDSPDDGATFVKRRLVMLASTDDAKQKHDTQLLVNGIDERIADIGFSVQLVLLKDLSAQPDEQELLAQCAQDVPDAAGCFWVGQSQKGPRLNLVIFDEKTEWEVTRTLEGQGIQAQVETIGVIIRTTISALLANREAASKKKRQDTVPPEPEKTALLANREAASKKKRQDTVPPEPENKVVVIETKQKPSYSLRAEVGAGYDLGLTTGGDELAHAVLVYLSLYPTERFAVYAGYVATFPLEYAKDDYSLKLVYHPFQLGLLVNTKWKMIEFAGSLALMLNYITHEQSASDPTISLEEQNGYLQLALTPGLKATFWLIDSVGLFVTAGADFLFTRPKYQIERNDKRETVVEPWPVVPHFSAGATLRFF